ncbi:glycosyl transferase family 1 [Methylovirgula sp. 4M-Z18]|uniref:glycosyl transferase family 1 n=1 Tax=Methylovirgula sp. 4M-Z18 TaxID=2293567 RepID=UPI000E2FAC60|nr:glycosyl transferase family 1 [Methylovirgula sp. 4M-Z18]RFB75507.1 glycosyl transferase family 1 [Methylovirgula sp. 4M-Z18]
MKIAYFVHDLSDAAVHRRIRMLAPFADLVVLGFRRSDKPVATIGGITPIDLGRTADGQFAQRIRAVMRAAAAQPRWLPALTGVTHVMARQLETLALAARARRRIAPQAPLIFECLDIHRLMLDAGPVGLALRGLEQRLLRKSGLLVVSSPAFVEAYFAPRQHIALPVHLLENKMLASELDAGWPGNVVPPPAKPPWRIGWFGQIRCRRSLLLLAELARQLPRSVEVIIRGRVSTDVIPDFDAIVAATPGLSFHGRYDRATMLGRIYGEVHFNWAMDFFEAGGNSEWLLPNRLYEGGAFGVVPIAFGRVETGRWLARHNAGVLLDEPIERSLLDFFRALTPDAYSTLRAAAARIDASNFVDDSAACAQFVHKLASLRATA